MTGGTDNGTRVRWIARALLRGALGGVLACSVVILWARQVSILALLFWALILAPVGACTALLICAVRERRPSALWGPVCILLGAVAGTLLIYLEAFIYSALRPDLLPDPMATSNIVLGVAA